MINSKRKAIDQATIDLVKSDYKHFQDFTCKVCQDHGHQKNRCDCSSHVDSAVQNSLFPWGFLFDTHSLLLPHLQLWSHLGQNPFFFDNLSMKNMEQYFLNKQLHQYMTNRKTKIRILGNKGRVLLLAIKSGKHYHFAKHFSYMTSSPGERCCFYFHFVFYRI